jgi:hemoglobin/transferrin/lactoferrin receptor protein
MVSRRAPVSTSVRCRTRCTDGRSRAVSRPRAATTAGIAYDRDDWGAELAGTLVERKDRLPIAEPSQDPSAPPPTPLFPAPGYATLDFYAHWHPLERIELFGGVTNIGDRRYWNWSNVAGFAESSRIDLYSAPGRAVRVGLRATF